MQGYSTDYFEHFCLCTSLERKWEVFPNQLKYTINTNKYISNRFRDSLRYREASLHLQEHLKLEIFRHLKKREREKKKGKGFIMLNFSRKCFEWPLSYNYAKLIS